MARERSSKAKVGKAWTRIPSPQRPHPDTAVAALESWKRSDSWTKDAGQFIPGLHRWIEERKWDDLPASLERPRPKAPPPDIPPEFIEWAKQHSPSIGPAVAWKTPAIRDRFEDERKKPPRPRSKRPAKIGSNRIISAAAPTHRRSSRPWETLAILNIGLVRGLFLRSGPSG
jgi:hypothetical protein